MIKNTISQSLFFTQWSIRFASLYNVTLFMLISMILQHFSAIAYIISNSNPNFVGFMANCRKMLIQITFETKEYGKYD